jgi:hypothetical protein
MEQQMYKVKDAMGILASEVMNEAKLLRKARLTRLQANTQLSDNETPYAEIQGVRQAIQMMNQNHYTVEAV